MCLHFPLEKPHQVSRISLSFLSQPCCKYSLLQKVTKRETTANFDEYNKERSSFKKWSCKWSIYIDLNKIIASFLVEILSFPFPFPGELEVLEIKIL